MSEQAILEVAGLQAWYEESHALHGVSFEVREGEVVTLVGRNGAGKTTILKSIMGLMGRTEGRIRYRGTDTLGLRPDLVARLGIAFCPEERAIFRTLTVAENLALPPISAPGGLSLAEIHALFPNLAERSASGGMQLSGGEQQMLAIARILRTGSRLLLLDEPSEGLAPVIVKMIVRTIRELKARGFTIVLVEQNLRFAQTVSDRHCVVDHGKIVDLIPRADFAQSAAKLQAYLGV